MNVFQELRRAPPHAKGLTKTSPFNEVTQHDFIILSTVVKKKSQKRTF